MHISKWVVFDLNTRLLVGDDRIDELIKIVVEVCEAEPEFLDPVDAKRHVFFLRALSGFNPPDWAIYGLGRKAGEPARRTGDFPIKNLAKILKLWVLSQFEHSQLLPHFALDTAAFVLAIAHGLQRLEPHLWRIEPLVAEVLSFGDIDRSFLAEFTRRSSGSIIVGTVPDGFNVIGDFYEPAQRRRKHTVEISSSTQFAFRVKRCHLSSPWNDFRSAQSIEPELKIVAPLRDEFRFVGNIRPLFDQSNDMNERSDWDNLGYFEVPHEWITHEVQVHGGNNWTLVPWPTWETSAEVPPPQPTVANPVHATRVTTPVQRPTNKREEVHPVPAAPVCSVCGREVSLAMLVWKPEQRFCRHCKRGRNTTS